MQNGAFAMQDTLLRGRLQLDFPSQRIDYRCDLQGSNFQRATRVRCAAHASVPACSICISESCAPAGNGCRWATDQLWQSARAAAMQVAVADCTIDLSCPCFVPGSEAAVSILKLDK